MRIYDIFMIEVLDFAFGIHWDVPWPDDADVFFFVEPYSITWGCDVYFGRLIFSFCTPFPKKSHD